MDIASKGIRNATEVEENLKQFMNEELLDIDPNTKDKKCN